MNTKKVNNCVNLLICKEPGSDTFIMAQQY